jgi:hypothetical protein
MQKVKASSPFYGGKGGEGEGEGRGGEGRNELKRI